MFPNDEHTISEWVCSGISLGGHSTWIVLAHEPRVKLGIPIIGCPDYQALMADRIVKNSLTMGPPYFPQTLTDLIQRTGASNKPEAFIGKRVVVLSGGADQLVPWEFSQPFVDQLQKMDHVDVEVKVYEGSGHEVHPEMLVKLRNAIFRNSNAPRSKQ
eukprot:TRINITY_DN7205_c0_g1_i2.p1 TRINITY_DN7205_c0_g1~~TRINITY_DN7205_c0_g1_i2.p1  ORF type:complete len:158 (+),score=25.97 TRINITY_DN7205_c0_g1_i2:155-628(+)